VKGFSFDLHPFGLQSPLATEKVLMQHTVAFSLVCNHSGPHGLISYPALLNTEKPAVQQVDLKHIIS
jgi:hypothetical protein